MRSYLRLNNQNAEHYWEFSVQDASGGYLLGGFDGEAFKLDSLTPLKMNASGDFYASQTFYRRTFPDDRVVQRSLGDESRGDLQGPVAQPVGDRVRLFDQLAVEGARAGGRGPARGRARGTRLRQQAGEGEPGHQTGGQRGLETAAEKQPPRDVARARHA